MVIQISSLEGTVICPESDSTVLFSAVTLSVDPVTLVPMAHEHEDAH